MDDETRALIDRASRGDALAVDELLQRNLPALRAFIRLRSSPAVRAHDSVSDLAQSVCREVLEHADRFQHGGESGFRYWLFTTALRLIQNRHARWHAKKRGEGRVQGHDDDAVMQAYRSISSPSARAMANEQAQRIEEAFDRLSDEDREVIALARVVGLSHQEIAERTGRREGAVRMHLLRALTRLANILDRPGSR